jgi:class 3 adenylate cyclase
MHFFMDRHDFVGMTAEEVAKAHLKDLEVQAWFDVQFIHYWFDFERQTGFCMAKAPRREAVEAAHRESHGLAPNQVIEIDSEALNRFMGGITAHEPGEPYVETAFRTIVFTDLEDSTSFTQRYGDARAMAMVRSHDRIVREAIRSHAGTEVKHTGDGLMAAFLSVASAIQSAVQIQRQLAALAAGNEPEMRVRIGIAAGEPVTESNDLFGAAVQLAARLSSRAEGGAILVSSAVRDLALGKSFAFRSRGRLRLKGFDEPQSAYEVMWHEPADA